MHLNPYDPKSGNTYLTLPSCRRSIWPISIWGQRSLGQETETGLWTPPISQNKFEGRGGSSISKAL